MSVALLSFSARGQVVAERLAEALGGTAQRCGGAVSLSGWTKKAFDECDALVFVGAVGIAVRAIAPFVKDKATDPAVVAVDEAGHFAVPLLSGHLGGANDLARRIGRLCGAAPIITTATDGSGVFAVDEWARYQNCAVVNKEAIKTVSGRLLAGERVRVRCPWPITGTAPEGVEQIGQEGAQVCVNVYGDADAEVLCLAPRIVALGLGCRKNTPHAVLEEAFAWMVRRSGVWEQAIFGAASIDVKENEPGLLAFCAAHGWPCRFFSAQALCAAAGTFTASAFVAQTVGVDNVCERSAVLCSGGTLLWRKETYRGVTMALAVAPWTPDWRWQDDGK